MDTRIEGIAVCKGLESLSIKSSADLTDSSLMGISLGCPRLAKFHIQRCKKVTEMGMKFLTCVLRKTLVDHSLGVLLNNGLVHNDFDLNEFVEDESMTNGLNNGYNIFSTSTKRHVDSYDRVKNKKCKYSSELQCNGSGFLHKSWDRSRPKPSDGAFGLLSLARYPELVKMKLDCGDVIGTSEYFHSVTYYCSFDCWWISFLTDIQGHSLPEMGIWGTLYYNVGHLGRNKGNFRLPVAVRDSGPLKNHGSFSVTPKILHWSSALGELASFVINKNGLFNTNVDSRRLFSWDNPSAKGHAMLEVASTSSVLIRKCGLPCHQALIPVASMHPCRALVSADKFISFQICDVQPLHFAPYLVPRTTDFPVDFIRLENINRIF
ncbi:hypothetical protein IFM89_031111 [Coptis chinensis]|uniref:F-box protein n=1 Tax=Coptis chinensis TaxID=261450 RepID=A0A835ISM9_9MAGN|nr:hypothetical protein IFM89_031111 [Coptis chinensis]